MRLTGDELGRPKRGGPRTTVRQYVRFFKDSTDLTEIRWYGVPRDRPVVPFPGFVANEAWTNENGPVSGMDYGFPPSHQGVQYGELKYESVNPKDQYNPLTVCGDRGQWAGDLRASRPSDLGNPDCCGRILLTDDDAGGVLLGGEEFSIFTTPLVEFSGVLLGGAELTGFVVPSSDGGGVLLDGQDSVIYVIARVDDPSGVLFGGAELTPYPVSDFGGLLIGGAESAGLGSTDPGGLLVGGPEATAYLSFFADGSGLLLGGADTFSYRIVVGDGSGLLAGGAETSAWNPTAYPPGDGGGLLIGGAETATPPSGGTTTGCSQCPGGAPVNWQVTLSGGTGDFAALNGVYTVVYDSSCIWRLDTTSISITHSNSGFGWRVFASAEPAGIPSAGWTVSGTFHCLAGNAWSLSTSSGSGTPPTCSTSPL